MKTQVARQFSLMVKQLKLSRDGAGDGAAAVRAESSRAASSDLAQAAANPGLLERITTNPGLFEFRASSDARTSSEAYDASSEDRASLSNRSGEAAADAAATTDGSHWPPVRAAFYYASPHQQGAFTPGLFTPGASPAVGLRPGASTREQALARSRNARGPMQQAVSGIDGINLSLPWPSTAAASTTSASCSVDAGLSGAYRSQEMWKRVKASVGHARVVSDSPKPVFTRSTTRDLVHVARAAARGRHEIDTTSEAFSSPFTGLAQALHRPAGAPAAAASAPASAAGELQLSGLPLQRTVGCRATAPAAAATVPSLKAAGKAVVAGHRMQRLGALRAPPPEGWPPMEGAPAGDDRAAREAARSWLSKLEGDLLEGNSL